MSHVDTRDSFDGVQAACPRCEEVGEDHRCVWDRIAAEWDDRRQTAFTAFLSSRLEPVQGGIAALLDGAWKTAMDDTQTRRMANRPDGATVAGQLDELCKRGRTYRRGVGSASYGESVNLPEVGEVMVLTWTYLKLLIEWEHTDHHDALVLMAVAASEQAAARADSATGDTQLVLRALDATFRTLAHQVNIEVALFGGSPCAMVHESRQALKARAPIEQILADVSTAGELGPVVDLLRSDVEAIDVYYGALVEIGRVTDQWRRHLRARTAPGGDVKGLEVLAGELAHARAVTRCAIERLDEPDLTRPPLDPVLATELRSHDRSLAAIEELVTSAAPVFHLVEAEVTIMYPFGLPDHDPTELHDAVRSRGEKNKPIVLAGMEAKVQPAILTDAWVTSGPQQTVHVDNDATTLVLPSLTIETADGERWEDVDATVTVSSLGNHYLAISLRTDTARLFRKSDGLFVEDERPPPWSPQDLDQHIRRGCFQVGIEKITSVEDHKWSRLVQYAETITEAIPRVASELIGTGDPTLAVSLTDVHAAAHVVVRVDRALAIHPDGTQEEVHPAPTGSLGERGGEDRSMPEARHRAPGDSRDGHGIPDDEVPGAAVLRIPQRLQPISVETWTRIEGPPVDNLLDGLGMPRDRLTCVQDVTVLWMPEQPNWSVLHYEQIAFLAVSLKGVYTSWSVWLTAEVGRMTRLIDDAAGVDSTLAHLVRLSAEITERVTRLRLWLRHFDSPQLVRSATERALVDGIVEAGGAARFSATIDAMAAVLVEQQERITALAERRKTYEQEREKALQEQRDRQSAAHLRRLDLLLAVLGVVGVTSALDWLRGTVIGAIADSVGVRITTTASLVLAMLQLSVVVALVTGLIVLWRARGDDADGIEIVDHEKLVTGRRWIPSTRRPSFAVRDLDVVLDEVLSTAGRRGRPERDDLRRQLLNPSDPLSMTVVRNREGPMAAALVRMPPGEVGELVDIVTHPDHRAEGVASMLLQHLGARWHEEHVPAVLARIEVAGGAGSADDRLAGRVAVESELVSFYARRGARILNLALGDSGTVSGGCSSEIVLVLQAEGDELSRELVRSWVRTTRPKMADPVVEDLAGRPAVAILSVDRLDDLLRRQARGEAPVTATPAAVGSRR